jgi:hypothetical protein
MHTTAMGTERLRVCPWGSTEAMEEPAMVPGAQFGSLTRMISTRLAPV